MSQSASDLADTLAQRFRAAGARCSVHYAEVTLEVAAASIVEVALALRDEEGFQFRQLVDLCGIDYVDHGRADWETSETTSSTGFSRAVQRRIHDEHEEDEEGRFAVIYHLLSHTHNRRVRIRAMLSGEPPRIDSVTGVWPSADWYEREAFDLFGILFVEHPDLRRLLTDYGFIGHPFRKDFPLIGEVEMRYDPAKGRVVYEPVSIEPRILVPKVIRHDERYDPPDSEIGSEDGSDEAA